MPIVRLDHINVRTHQLDTMIEWYTRVLGFTQGARPDFRFPGAWMYIDDTPMVHLVDALGNKGVGAEKSLKIEHFAFSANNKDEFEKKLTFNNIEFKTVDIPEINLIQYNLWDPDGNHIHVDFALNE